MLVICLRCAFSENSEIMSFFWDLVELNHTKAAVIKDAIFNHLRSHAMNVEVFLKPT